MHLKTSYGVHFVSASIIVYSQFDIAFLYTVKPVCNDHLYNKMYYLWFIQ